METRRLEIHELLCKILGCPTEGEDLRCYYDPPPNIHMNYPAIVYHLSNVDTDYANNKPHRVTPIFMCTLISRNPALDIFQKLLWLPKASFNRSYISDNLVHRVFTIY